MIRMEVSLRELTSQMLWSEVSLTLLCPRLLQGKETVHLVLGARVVIRRVNSRGLAVDNLAARMVLEALGAAPWSMDTRNMVAKSPALAKMHQILNIRPHLRDRPLLH